MAYRPGQPYTMLVFVINMLEFYKKITTAFFILAICTSLVAYLLMELFFVKHALLPAHESKIPWKIETITDAREGGSSSISVNDATYDIDYDYVVRKDLQYPYVTLILAFADLYSRSELIDLTKYSTATFKIKCSHRNQLSFSLHSYDDDITDPADFSSYRVARLLFNCHSEWREIEVDLLHMMVPMWWSQNYNVDLSSQDYWLDKTIAFSFGTSQQGPAGTPTNIKISELTLHGHDWRYAYALMIILGCTWAGFVVWLVRQYTTAVIEDLKEKLQNDRPLIAYQQLSIEPHKNKEKSQLLRFMATQYANPDLSLDMAIATLGFSRSKINEILKEELGFTFNVYMNKLRLTEAARLLSEKNEASIAEIAYSVGYNDASYFNKLFKNEYGCTPKTFRNMDHEKEKG